MSDKDGMKQFTDVSQKMNTAMMAVQQKIRSSTQKKSVYPWNNHDFNYTGVIDKQYNPKKMGITDEPCPGPFTDDVFKLVNYPIDVMTKAIPADGDRAGVTDVDQSNTDMVKIKNIYGSWSEPYPNFSLENSQWADKLKQGKYASSYVIKTGTCPVKSITDRQTCEKRGFKWVLNPITLTGGTGNFFKGMPITDKKGNGQEPTPGNCFQPRYTFVDNSAGGPIGAMKGLVPTIGKEVMELNPLELYNIATTGTSSSGDFKQQKCMEGFETYRRNARVNKVGNVYVYLIVIIGLVFLLVYALLSR